MSYQQQVEAHHRLTFSRNVMLAAQMMNNPLRDAVTIVPASGEAQDIADLINAIEYTEGEDNSRRNPENVPDRARRWLVRPGVIESGQYITKEEKFDQSQDPTSSLVLAHTKAVNRGLYDRILGVKKTNSGFSIAGGGILGKIYEGKNPNSTKSLPGGNFIAHGSEGLTAAKLRAATEAMELEDFGLETDQEIFGLITPKQKTDLINLALETKASLNPFDVENIREGKPGRLLGINWLFSNRVPTDSNGHRMVPLWSKDNIVCGMWQDIVGDMWNDTNAKNLPYIYVDAYPACGRVQDGGVRVIPCVES